MTERSRRSATAGEKASPPAPALEAFEALAAGQRAAPGVDRKRMFGREGLRVAGRYYAFLDRDCLIVRLTMDEVTLVAPAGDVTTAQHVSPSMRRGWSCVPLASPPEAGTKRWSTLMTEARTRAQAHGRGPE